jgi:hypothetical protein
MLCEDDMENCVFQPAKAGLVALRLKVRALDAA